MPNQQAVNLWMQARAKFDEPTRTANDAARQLLIAAIDIDKNFARAYGHLSYVHVRDALFGWSSSAAASLVEAQRNVDIALKLDPNDYDNHWSHAIVLLNSRKIEDALVAYQMVERTIQETDAAYPKFLAESVEAWIRAGRPVGAVMRAEWAIKLQADPVPTWYRWNQGYAHLMNGDPAAALKILQSIESPDGPILVDIAVATLLSDRTHLATARALLDEARKLDPAITLATMERQAFPSEAVKGWYLAALKELGLT